MSLDTQIEALRALLTAHNRIVAFTGAGVSVDSGIPDFRSRGGLWDRLDPMTLSTDALEAGPTGRVAFWRTMEALADSLGDPHPNPIHHALVELERQGRLAGILTQNVDGLHQAAGSDPGLVVELHGNLAWCVEPISEVRFPTPQIMARVKAGERDPKHAGRPIRPELVVFGDPLPEEAMQKAWAMAGGCDLMLVLGTSLTVHPAADLPVLARHTGAKLAIVTLGRTPVDHLADLRIDAPLLASFVPAVEGM
ncbi:MAG: hypothetical protein H6702_08630 [Myxococcales bacterium]|nr:hypothetical protein [Myxococcales bacterium]